MAKSADIPRRRLGRTGIQVTVIGLGGAYVGHTDGGFDDALAEDTVCHALELGINLIDTSPLYGESQRRIGRGLRVWFGSGGRREDLVLSTKAGSRPNGVRNYTARHFHESVKESLDLLHTDYIDVLQVHDPPDLDPVFADGGALEALRQLKNDGVIRAIGLGVREHEKHQRFMAGGDLDVSLTYSDFNLLVQSAVEGVLAPAAATHVGVFNATSLADGLLAGSDPAEAAGSKKFSLGDVARAGALWEYAQRRGLGLLALNTQFCLRDTRLSAVLFGAATPGQIEADLQALMTPIPDEVWRDLSIRFGLVSGT